jgi:D-aminoacyl-tRNA deacylase
MHTDLLMDSISDSSHMARTQFEGQSPMRVVIQRVEHAHLILVNLASRTTHASIHHGLVVLLGIEEGDTERDSDWIGAKLSTLRIFEDSDEKMNLSAFDLDPAAQVLVVPNFTVAGSAKKGRRPDFTNAMKPPMAQALFERVCEVIADHGIVTKRGVFGADMRVELINDGPITMVIDSPNEQST